MNVKKWIEAVQRGERARQVLVIVGGKGSGKSVAVRLLETAFPHIHSVIFAPRHLGRANIGPPASIAVTEVDLVTIDEIVSGDELDLLKNLISTSEIDVEVRGKGRETRTIKANLITTTQFWPPMSDDRRFIVTTPIELIANLIPFLAR